MTTPYETATSRLGSVRWREAARVGALVSALAAAGLHVDSVFARDTAPVVETLEGTVRGLTKDGVSIFLGIPFAAPPLGDLRWRPPQPVTRWRGVRDATHFASNCAQVSDGSPFAGPPSISEDCLYLNVFTTRGSQTATGKPVIVWLHGGGNFAGEASDYDGSKLASGGSGGVETVVVTVNYRLGLFGTFSHPAIDSEGHAWGNYTILDQQAAMHWVQRNIKAFGGDPKRVALGGQSAGAYDVGANVLSPLARGLFNRAIIESSPGLIAALMPAALVRERGTKFAVAAGCPGTDASAAKCLRHLSAARILQVQGTINNVGSYVSFKPFVDGTILPMAPEQAWSSGQFNKMPVLGGATKDEGTFFTGTREYFTGIPQTPMSTDQFTAMAAAGAPCVWCNGFAVPAGAAARYRIADHGGDPAIAYERIQTDTAKCQELHVLQKIALQVPVYAYDFVYPDAPYYFPKMPGFRAMAAHTIDIQFLFNDWHGGLLGVNLDQTTGQPRELNAAESRLSDQLVAAWTRFADTGNPNGKGDFPWPKLTPGASGRYLVQDLRLSTMPVSQFRHQYKCDFWDKPPT